MLSQRLIKNLFVFALMTFSLSLSQVSLAQSFPAYKVGSGAKFQLKVGGATAESSIAIVQSTPTRTVVEIFINTPSIMSSRMWQQFHIVPSGGKVKIEKGLFYTGQLPTPEIMPPENLKGYDGVQMESFMIGSMADMKKRFVGNETVKVPAGSVKAQHYRVKQNGQILDFWISDEAKPVGIVKIESRGSLPKHNYQLELVSLLKNVKRKIDPAKARPLSPLGKSLLPSTGAGMMLP